MTLALTTLANLKTFMGIKAGDVNADRDAALAMLITQCSMQVENYVQRPLDSVQRTEYYDGTSSDQLITSQYPVTAISLVEVNGSAVVAAATPMQAGWWLDNHGVILTGGLRFTRGRRNVKVTYTAGYATVPPDLELVAQKMITNTYKGRDWIGYSSKTLATENIQFKDEFDKPAQKSVLNNYRKVVPL